MMAHSKIFDHYMYTQIINTFFFLNMIMVNSTATENITAKKEARKLFNVRSNLSNNEKKGN